MATIGNRPVGQIDANYVVNQNSYESEAFQGDYQGGTNLIYAGYARPGADTANAVWQISKQTYDANSNITAITWPLNSQNIASNDYEFIWNNRASLTYV